jgi:hypothetical protein
MLAFTVIMGIYLRLHLKGRLHDRARPVIVYVHGIFGKVMPLVSWTQMLFGGITALGFCHEDHLGQCLAHFIMGSAFIIYGALLTVLLLVGQFWLRRTGHSQEFFDSIVIAVWGCINTFTEHRWGHPWEHNDLQHTSMGVIWWVAGLLGIWLSKKRNGRPKRNLIPGIVIFLTGYAMSAHTQELMLSTMVHAVFGYTLMAAGLARIIEISFVLKDRSTISPHGTDANSFQYLTPFVCIHPSCSIGGFCSVSQLTSFFAILAPLRLRVSLPGRHGRADANVVGCGCHARVLRTVPLQFRSLHVPL